MARLIPTLILFFCFSLLLSSSHARSPVASTEDDAVDVPLPTADQQKDDSELESIILLPSDKLPESDRGSAAEIEGDGEEKRVGDEKLSDEQPEKEEEEEEREFPEKANWRPMDRDLDRMREIRSRHRGPRFGGGDQVRSGRMPFWKERNDAVDEDERYHHHHHHHHHRGPHGEMFAGRWIDGPGFPGADGEPMMKGEFKQPRFFFHRHHHRHHHHHHGDFDFYRGEERQGRGFWNAVRRFFGGN